MIYEITNIGRLPRNTPDDDRRIGRKVVPYLEVGKCGMLLHADGSGLFLQTKEIKSVEIKGAMIYFETDTTQYTLKSIKQGDR